MKSSFYNFRLICELFKEKDLLSLSSQHKACINVLLYLMTCPQTTIDSPDQDLHREAPARHWGLPDQWPLDVAAAPVWPPPEDRP